MKYTQKLKNLNYGTLCMPLKSNAKLVKKIPSHFTYTSVKTCEQYFKPLFYS